jgi:hypothetical protein
MRAQFKQYLLRAGVGAAEAERAYSGCRTAGEVVEYNTPECDRATAYLAYGEGFLNSTIWTGELKDKGGVRRYENYINAVTVEQRMPKFPYNKSDGWKNELKCFPKEAENE